MVHSLTPYLLEGARGILSSKTSQVHFLMHKYFQNLPQSVSWSVLPSDFHCLRVGPSQSVRRPGDVICYLKAMTNGPIQRNNWSEGWVNVPSYGNICLLLYHELYQDVFLLSMVGVKNTFQAFRSFVIKTRCLQMHVHIHQGHSGQSSSLDPFGIGLVWT